MSRRVIGPFNRVEGDLEVRIESHDGRVSRAEVVSPLYRGFEQMLHGKDPRDALVYAPRICGICSISQSLAAARALAALQGLSPPPNGQYAQDLLLAAENMVDHLTHFYLFFMPDFARDCYRDAPWHEGTLSRFRAVKGEAARAFLPARAGFLHIMGLLAGKWPHSLAIQPGGLTKTIGVAEKMRLITILAQFRRFLEETVFGDALEAVDALTSQEALEAWGARQGAGGDFSRFLEISNSIKLDELGRWQPNRFLSYGAYGADGESLFAGGLFADGELHDFAQGAISEDGAHSWLAATDGPKHPFNGTTIPDADAAGGYSWCKAPRLDGEVVEMGALARQLVGGHPLIRDLAARGGGNVFSRVAARLVETARLLPAMEQWADKLEPGAPFYREAPMPADGEGFGLVEAARGGLGHWLRVQNNCILNYQIIAPTTWNFSPRDREGTPGALEQALVGAPVRDGEADPVAVQHIVRSFDPCMVCTVH